jgi:hypothetical protein
MVIALIMINARAAGRSRRLGVLGVIALFFCIVLGRLNGSVGPWLNVKYPSGIDYYGLGLIFVAALGAGSILLLVWAAAAGRRTAQARGGH